MATTVVAACQAQRISTDKAHDRRTWIRFAHKEKGPVGFADRAFGIMCGE